MIHQGIKSFVGSIIHQIPLPKIQYSIIITPDISAEEKEFWSKMSIGPNPTSDFLFISMQDSAKNKISKIELYQQSSLGTRVYHQDIHQSSLSRSWDWKPYFQYRTHNPFTSW